MSRELTTELKSMPHVEYFMKQCKFVSSAGLSVALAATLAASAHSQTNGYAIGEGKASGPVRMAHVAYETGNVSWRPTESQSWSGAKINLPARQGSEFWAKSGSRLELQFDDGSTMELGGGGLAVLQTMYSDSNGEFTEIKLENGLATLKVKSKYDQFQIDTPSCSAKAVGPASVRVGATASEGEICVRSGQAELSSPSGNRTVTAGHDVTRPVSDSVVAAEYRERPAPAEDDWDRWSDQRNSVAYENRYVPEDISLTSADLDSYGTWYDDPKYGHVWCPRESAGWRPYHDGSWTWVSPIGWTWVGAEPWGWAPYHYGTWYRARWGWSWYPGPATQYWSPAVVDYSDDGVNVAWAPLAPWEVRYPASIGIGFGGPNWWLSFSIGGVGCYYPYGPAYCVARPWDNTFINYGWGWDPGFVAGYYGETAGFSVGFYGHSAFRPYYAVNGGGVFASRSAFATGARFSTDPAASARIWRNGRSFTGVPTRGSQLAGPLGVRPSARSFSPTHSATTNAPSHSLASRSVVRGSVARNIAARTANTGRAAFRTASAAGTRAGRSVSTSKAALTRNRTHGGSARPASAARTTRTAGGRTTTTGHGGRAASARPSTHVGHTAGRTTSGRTVVRRHPGGATGGRATAMRSSARRSSSAGAGRRSGSAGVAHRASSFGGSHRASSSGGGRRSTGSFGGGGRRASGFSGGGRHATGSIGGGGGRRSSGGRSSGFGGGRPSGGGHSGGSGGGGHRGGGSGHHGH